MHSFKSYQKEPGFMHVGSLIPDLDLCGKSTSELLKQLETSFKCTAQPSTEPDVHLLRNCTTHTVSAASISLNQTSVSATS